MPTLPPLRLGVNIDHVATVRNARGGKLPDPLRAARIAEAAGADGITAHLREDRRHIVDGDIEGLMRELKVPLNFEMAATEEMVGIALRQERFEVQRAEAARSLRRQVLAAAIAPVLRDFGGTHSIACHLDARAAATVAMADA